MTESVPAGKSDTALVPSVNAEGNTAPTTPAIGRNEPCPCGSRKKFKRCCGVDAAPKLTESKKPTIDPSMLGDMNPEFMSQVGQALQRLPRGQLQRLQGMMQRAMNGADVSAEAADLERNLPPDFKNLMQSWQGMAGGMPGMEGAAEAMAAAGGAEGMAGLAGLNPSEAEPAMTEEEARRLVEAAAKEGAIPVEQAEALLQPTPQTDAEAESKLGKFWRGLSGKNKS